MWAFLKDGINLKLSAEYISTYTYGKQLLDLKVNFFKLTYIQEIKYVILKVKVFIQYKKRKKEKSCIYTCLISQMFRLIANVCIHMYIAAEVYL